MKKLLTIILIFCVCLTSSATLIACSGHTHTFTQESTTEDFLKSTATCVSKAVYYKSCSCGEKGTETFEFGEFGEHSFTSAWSKDNGKHWHACQNANCQEKSSESVHSYVSGTCECGEEEAPIDIHVVTESQWQNAFSFENVTINRYVVDGEHNIPMETYLIDGEDATMVVGGMQVPMEGYANYIRVEYNFVECYDVAQYQNGKYRVASFDVYGDESYVYENVDLTFENSVLISIVGTIKKEVPEYDGEDNVIGTTVETSVGYFEFVNYGTTDTTVSSSALPISQTEWENVFDAENFDNMTITASFSIGSTSYVESIYYSDGTEKIILDGYENVEFYYVNSTWYKYYVDSATYAPVEIFDSEYPFVNISDSFKNFFSTLKNMYALLSYDSVNNIYYFTDGTSIGYYVTIDDGEVTSLTTSFVVENEMSTYHYRISNYGTTSFVVPFDFND